MRECSFSTRKKQIRPQNGSLTEFGPALFILLVVIVFPLVDLIALASGVASVSIIAQQCASRAGSSPNYTQALDAVVNEAQALTKSGLGKFARLEPIEGYNNSGAELYVEEININTSEVHSYSSTDILSGVNNLAPPPADPANNVYQLTAQLTYDVGPFLNLSAFPFFKDIPALGKPATISYKATRVAEFPDGIIRDDGSGSSINPPYVPPENSKK